MADYSKNLAAIDKLQKAGVPASQLARKLFCYDHPFVFGEKQDTAFQIFNDVAIFFNVSVRHVKAVGSGQVGYSFFKNKPFTEKESDFDLAIIDVNLFCHYSELTYRITSGYTIRTEFHRQDNKDTYQPFIFNLAIGYFRPDLMPNCREKRDWLGYFTKLSNGHSDLFKKINCGIYLSEKIFELRQAQAIENYYSKPL